MTIQTSDDNFNLKSGKAVNMKSAGGDFNTDTSNNMNATKGTLSVDDAKTIDDALDPNQADIPITHSVAGPPSTSGPPKSPGSMIKSTAAIVPHHEPWFGHKHDATPGRDTAVNPSSIPKLS